MRQILDGGVVRLDPRQALRMGQDGNVAGNDQLEEQIVQSERGDMVWGLDQNVARISQRQQLARTQAGHEIGHNVYVGTDYQL
jgi:hypothetical protein